MPQTRGQDSGCRSAGRGGRDAHAGRRTPHAAVGRPPPAPVAGGQVGSWPARRLDGQDCLAAPAVPEVLDGKYRMLPKHARPGIAHNDTNLIAHVRLVAVDGTLSAGGLPFLE